MQPNPPALPLTERLRPGIAAAAAMVLIATAGLWLTTGIIALLPSEAAAADGLLTAFLYYVPFVLLPLLLYCRRFQGLSDGLRLNPMPVLPTLMVAFMALLCVYAASAVDGLWTLLLTALGIHAPDLSAALMGGGNLTLQIIVSAAIPAVCEELLFRGAVFSAFERRGTFSGLWASSALFALLHGNLFGLPAYFLVGAVSAFIVYALDSVYAGMVFHTVYNAAILTVYHMLSKQPELAAQATAAGATVQPLSLIGDLLLVGLMLASMLTTLNLRRRAAGIQPVPKSAAPLSRYERAMLVAAVVALVFNNILIQALTEAGL